MVGLPDGEQTLRMDVFCGVDKIPACDRQTSCGGIVRAMHTRRAVMMSLTTKMRLYRSSSVVVALYRVNG